MKWAGEHQTPEMVEVFVTGLPGSVRSQAHTLLERTGDDACYVAGPLQYAIEHGYGFSPDPFDELINRGGEGPKNFSRRGWALALSKLSDRYPQIPRILWDTFAIMGLRPSPHVEEGIPNLGHLLKHDWGVSDAALHAAAKATALWGDICHELALHSGCYPEHGCGCDHITRELPQGAHFPAMPRDRKEHVTREFWELFMAELALIYVLGFPFSLQEPTKILQYRGTLLPA